MAMVITKFHRLIGSRVFWIIFSFLVVVSFAITMVPNLNTHDLRATNNVGKVNGKSISSPEYNQASRLARNSSLFRLAPENRDQEKDTFLFIAAMKMAEELGLYTSAESVRQQIQTMVPGATPEERIQNYQAFLLMQYRGYNIGTIQQMSPSERSRLAASAEADFIEFSRIDQTITKLVSLVGSTPSISPSDVSDNLADFYRQFELDYAIIDHSAETNKLEVTDEEIRTFFEESKDGFRRPDQRKVKYIALPVRDYINTNSVDEATARSFYEANITRYSETVVATNAVPGAETSDVRIKTFDEVKGSILTLLGQAKARDEARRDADQFSASLIPRRGKPAQAFDDLKAQYGGRFPAYTSNWFSASQRIPGIADPERFGEVAFSLGTNERQRVSTPLVASNYVYVIVLDDKRDAHIPTLEEALPEVKMAASAHYTRKSKLDKAKAMEEKIKEGIAGGQSFTNVVTSIGLVATSLPPFSISGREFMQADSEFGIQLATMARNAAPGEILEPTIGNKGNVAIGYVRNIQEQPSPTPEQDTMGLKGQLVPALQEARLKAFYNYLVESTQIEIKPGSR